MDGREGGREVVGSIALVTAGLVLGRCCTRSTGHECFPLFFFFLHDGAAAAADYGWDYCIIVDGEWRT